MCVFRIQPGVINNFAQQRQKNAALQVIVAKYGNLLMRF